MIQQLIQGGLAGLVATAPMSLAMRAGERLVPWPWHGRLPPRQITERVLDKAGVRTKLDEGERKAAATVAHYAFGTGAGCLLGAAASELRTVPKPLAGVAVGMAVWAASYMGWLPAMGIRRNATEEPSGRNVQMIAAHLVWGCVAGVLLDQISNVHGRGRHRRR
jgi:hypothetical protein